MADTATEQPARAATDLQEASWSQVWHLPVLILGLGLFLLGIYVAMPEAEQSDFPGALDDAARYLAAGNLDEAQRRLEEIQPHIDEAPEVSRARMWQYWGDLNYQQLQRRAPSSAGTEAARRTNQQIITYYNRARELGRTLDSRSVRRYAQTLVALGRGDEALAMLDGLDDQPARQRYHIIRQLIDRHMERDRPPGSQGSSALAPLIERFRQELRRETDTGRRREQEIWVAGIEARQRLDAEAPQQAIDLLLRRIQRLSDDSDNRDLAPLRVLLARAYQHVGQFEDAERFYRHVQQQIDRTDGLNAEIHLGLGQIALAETGEMNVQRALEHFSRATSEYPSEWVFVDALIGRADCEARLDAHGEAMDHFALAVSELLQSAPPNDPRRAKLTDTVRTHVQRADDRDDHETALDYLTLLKPLHEPELPPELLLDLARAHEQIAREHRDRARRGSEAALGAGRGADSDIDSDIESDADAEADSDSFVDAGADGGDEAGEMMSRQAIRLANQEAAVHFSHAGDYYRQHAKAVTITDDRAHGESLWKAASCYDNAQLWSEAIEVYSEFVQTRRTDPRYLRAQNRMGKAYLADGQYEAAAGLLRELLEDHPHTLEAYDSLVPLAHAYLGMDEPDKAERTLLQVVTDHEAITPESTQYREALQSLGELYYSLGEQDSEFFVKAIERLNEAVQRYGHTAAGAELRYLLADSYRRSIGVLDERIEQQQSQSRRIELQSERSRRLQKAQRYYNQVLTELQARPENTLTEIQGLYLRNSYFYQADCAFDRGGYEHAIELYDLAARRYRQHPASLVALVQIVNAHCELGQFEEAHVANERARRQLERIPEEAFEDDTLLPMTRQHWEDWLRWTSEIDLFQQARR